MYHQNEAPLILYGARTPWEKRSWSWCPILVGSSSLEGGQTIEHLIHFGMEGAMVVCECCLTLCETSNRFFQSGESLCLCLSASIRHGRVNESTKLTGDSKTNGKKQRKRPLYSRSGITPPATKKEREFC